MAASIEDVARRAGVSVATVSRALRGLPNVAPSTRQRVVRAAEALHYVADPHAIRLATRRSGTVGLVLPLLGTWYYAQVLSGADGVLVARGYDLLPFTVSGDDVRERFLAALPYRKRVDGLVIADLPFTDEEWARLESSGTPMVTLGVRHGDLPSLTIDNVGAARSAVEHLLQLGHRRIGVLTSLPDDPFHFVAPLQRVAGYEAALQAAGIASDPQLQQPGGFSLRGGAEAMRRLLSLRTPPTAVFALSDEMAIGALQVAREQGLTVPGDVSILGFDDHDVAEFVGLTTVRQDVVEQGEAVARLLIEHLEDPSKTATHETLPTELVVRSTTGPRRQQAAKQGRTTTQSTSSRSVRTLAQTRRRTT